MTRQRSVVCGATLSWSERCESALQALALLDDTNALLTILVTKSTTETSVGTAQHKSPTMHEISDHDNGHFLDLEKRMSGIEA